MSSLTAYSTSCDGLVRNHGAGSWSSIQSASTGTLKSDSGDPSQVYVDGTTADKYIDRFFTSFDLSSIPAGSVITSATLSLWVTSKDSGAGGSVGITSAAPASTTVLATTDFGSVGSTDFATRINFASGNVGAYNDFAMNAAGLAYLTTKVGAAAGLAVRGSFDIDNSAPGTTVFSDWGISTSEHTGTSQDPKLVVTYTLVKTTADAWAWSDYAIPTSANSPLTFNSGAGDGRVVNSVSGTDSGTWASTRSAGTGTSVDYTTDSGISMPLSNNNAAGNTTIARMFLPFDTSSMPSASVPWSGTVSFVADGTADFPNGSLCLVAGTQASTSVLVTGDFDEVGSTELAYNRIRCADLVAGTRYTFVLNAAGVAAINKTGFSKFAVRTSYDLDNTYPAPSSGLLARLSEYTGTTSDPQLSVSYALTGKRTSDAWAWSDSLAIYRRSTVEVSIAPAAANTTLNGAQTLGSTITVADTSAFPSSGTIWAQNTLNTLPHQASATYTGKTSTTFTGCTWTSWVGKTTYNDGSLDFPDGGGISVSGAENYFPQITNLDPTSSTPELMITWTEKAGERGLNGKLAYRKSRDGGNTWDATAYILSAPSKGAGYGIFGHTMCRLKNGRLLVLWYEHQYDYVLPDSIGNYYTLMAYSDDRGSTWSSPAAMAGCSAYGPNAGFIGFSNLLVTSGGANATYGDVYVPYAVNDDGINGHGTGNPYRWYQKLMKIADGGTSGTWSEFATIATYAGCGNRANGEASLVVCGNGDWLAAARVEPNILLGDDGSADRDVWMARSTDAGATWGAPFKAIDGLGNAPILTRLPSGTIICTGSALVAGDTYYGATASVLSVDDGVTWIRSLKYESYDGTYTTYIGSDADVIINDPAVQVNTAFAYAQERPSQTGARTMFRWYVDPARASSDTWAWTDTAAGHIVASYKTTADAWAWSDVASAPIHLSRISYAYFFGGRPEELWLWSDAPTWTNAHFGATTDTWLWSDAAGLGGLGAPRPASDAWAWSDTAAKTQAFSRVGYISLAAVYADLWVWSDAAARTYTAAGATRTSTDAWAWSDAAGRANLILSRALPESWAWHDVALVSGAGVVVPLVLHPEGLPAGTSVGVYRRSEWKGSELVRLGAGPGGAVQTTVVAGDLTVALLGLPAGEWVLYSRAYPNRRLFFMVGQP